MAGLLTYEGALNRYVSRPRGPLRVKPHEDGARVHLRRTGAVEVVLVVQSETTTGVAEDSVVVRAAENRDGEITNTVHRDVLPVAVGVRYVLEGQLALKPGNGRPGSVDGVQKRAVGQKTNADVAIVVPADENAVGPGLDDRQGDGRRGVRRALRCGKRGGGGVDPGRLGRRRLGGKRGAGRCYGLRRDAGSAAARSKAYAQDGRCDCQQ